MTDVRQPTGTAFALRDPLSWGELSETARGAEALGYSAVFLPEIAGRDAFAALSGLAGETRELLLGTGIVPITSRGAMLTAMGAATVQERSGGRLVLGLGTGPSRPGALDRLRGTVEEVRALLAGGSVGGRRLSLDPVWPVPIWISALGPRAVRLAGEIADGLLLNWCTPERVSEAMAVVREAAEGAGRDPDVVTVAVYVRASLGGDAVAALASLRAATAEYASYPAYRRQFRLMGLGEEAERAAAAHAAGLPGEVPESLVRTIGLVGEIEEARERLQAFRDEGADLPVVYPVAGGEDPAASVRATLAALAPRRATGRP